jgi:hypothetical protein
MSRSAMARLVLRSMAPSAFPVYWRFLTQHLISATLKQYKPHRILNQPLTDSIPMSTCLSIAGARLKFKHMYEGTEQQVFVLVPVLRIYEVGSLVGTISSYLSSRETLCMSELTGIRLRSKEICSNLPKLYNQAVTRTTPELVTTR